MQSTFNARDYWQFNAQVDRVHWWLKDHPEVLDDLRDLEHYVARSRITISSQDIQEILARHEVGGLPVPPNRFLEIWKTRFAATKDLRGH